MNNTQLKYFIAAAEIGSMNAAAQTIGISRTALTQQIKLMEEELDTVLLERRGRKLELTPAGELIYSFARKTLIKLKKTEQTIRDIKYGVEELLVIGCSQTSLIDELSVYVGALTKQYPSIKVRLVYRPLWILLRMMNSGEVDVVISHQIKKSYDFNDEYVVKKIHEHPILAIIPPSLDLGEKPSISLRELDNQNLIISEKHENSIIDKYAAYGVKPHVKCVTKSSYSKIELVKQNVGIAFVSSAMTLAIEKAKLKSYFVDEIDKVFTEYVFYPRNRKTATVEKLLDVIFSSNPPSNNEATPQK